MARSMQKVVCKNCKRRKPINQFRTLSNGTKKYKSGACMQCAPSAVLPGSARLIKVERNKPHRGPIEREYREGDMHVVVLPPSAGWDFGEIGWEPPRFNGRLLGDLS